VMSQLAPVCWMICVWLVSFRSGFPHPWAAEHPPVGREKVSGFFFTNFPRRTDFYLGTILIRAVKVHASIYEIIVAEINAIQYFNAVNATLFTSGVRSPMTRYRSVPEVKSVR